MISVCLPVYNFDITELTEDLLRQAKESNIDIEILVFDDYSLSYYKKRNATLAKNKNVSYLEFDNNLGRSKIRNRLADFAKGEWLLFLDCDMIPESTQFLHNYNLAINKASVICGGIEYGPKPFKDELMLRWRYGVSRQTKSAARRQIFPYASFLSGNFMIHKDIFHRIRFNEEISGYGHEDTIFGLDLMHNNIPILHINNPCINLGIEPCFEYLIKSEHGIVNLVRLLRIVPHMKKDLQRNIRLLRYFRYMQMLGLALPLQWFFRFFNPFIRRVLCTTKPNLLLFDLYKLGLLSQIFNKHNLTKESVRGY